MPAQTSWSEHKREQWRPENKHIVGAVAMHTFLTGVARNKIQSNKILTGFCVPLFHPVQWVYLKPPMPMDTNLHVCGREANSVANYAKIEAKMF